MHVKMCEYVCNAAGSIWILINAVIKESMVWKNGKLITFDCYIHYHLIRMCRLHVIRIQISTYLSVYV